MRDADQRHGLKPAAARRGGLEAERFELGGDVGLGQFVAARAGAAAFEQIVGQEADVAAECRLGDGGVGRGDLGGVGLERALRIK